ncbi:MULTISPECIES: class III extradiol dioxygenase subunit B-like domain-containing protein [unclassified Nocardiopsis]|uniref:class III extradiol dioxygenase subunit B-like domain-containing protein n=1 Tax=unclassified Nocardiopsis TaxID=2649073 RepID=UPI00066DE087|nr:MULTISPECIES: class III extradiol dioxygenase subunit B-like domain-containing protein [unclassified Nocardiopsis]MBQ1082982.1 class III extradiol dioxygenase subunit B-like domain-containing protein [Nocardiopsis sp. B62]
MLIAAAVCPHPPVLFPEIARGAAPDLDGLRAACDRAVAGLRGADRLLVVGRGATERRFGPDTGGDLADFGVDLRVGPAPAVLDLAATTGRWLAERNGLEPDGYLEVPSGVTPERAAELGAELAGSADRVALLVMGDGSARRTEHSPGYVDERAVPHDDAVAEALGKADTARLAGLDPELALELMVAGRPAWQVLAGAAGEAALTGDLLAYEAPYGVGYFVATWS